MDTLKSINDIASLTEDVEDFFENPNFTPKEQNKFFFSNGTSYYKQLLQVCKLIKLLQESIKNIYSNQESIKSTIDSLDLSKLNDIPSRVETLEATASDLVTRVVALENDNTSNKARITNNENAIDLLKTRVSTNETNINSINISITSLQSVVNTFENRIGVVEEGLRNLKDDVQTNYLKDINITSEDIKATEVSRVDGTKTIQMEVVSSTPIDLGPTLEYVKQQNANVVTNVDDSKVAVDDENNAINVSQNVTSIVNGAHTIESKNIAKLDKDNFIVTDDLISTKLDYEETTNKLNEQENNLKGIQNDVNTNTTDIISLKEKDTSLEGDIISLKEKDTSLEGDITKLKSDVEETINTQLASIKTDVSNNSSNISSLETNVTTNESNISNNTSLITSVSNNLTALTNRYNGILLASGTDLNDIVDVGIYYCANNSALVNAPENEENNWGTVQVYPTADNSYVLQVWYSTDRATHTQVENYQRIIKVDKSEQWDWIKQITQTDLDTKQDTLVSGTNIKTINDENILGNGNLEIGMHMDLIWDTDVATESVQLFTKYVDFTISENIDCTKYKIFLIYFGSFNTNISDKYILPVLPTYDTTKPLSNVLTGSRTYGYYITDITKNSFRVYYYLSAGFSNFGIRQIYGIY